MTKPLHAGLAARNALQAVRLASSGFTASDDALDGPLGFVETYSGLSREDASPRSSFAADPRDCWMTLGEEWMTISPYGLALKPYPSCGATHPAIEAALLARAEVGDAEIEHVSVNTTENSSRILIYAEPTTGLEGKFSMQFCVAAALERGFVDLSTFSDASVRQNSTQLLLRSISVGVHPELRDNTEFAAEVTVRAAGGREVRRRVELAKGKRERWLTTVELRAKFRSCAEPVLGADQANEAFELAPTPSA
jgi:2-methylcitrate dehydratase PrpD